MAIPAIMKVWLLFSLFKGSYAEKCKNVPPGIYQMSQGVDIANLELRSNDQTRWNGFVQPVLEWNCSQGKLWTDPYTVQTYQHPTRYR